MPAVWAMVALLCLGARYQSPNFTVDAPTPQMAEQIGQAAEQYRRDLAQLWLTRTLPDWSQPCPITVRVGEHLGAGGATSFMFDRGEVYGWRMNIQGPLDRILDSVLPHEVTHTIFASHFRQPLPRWADEGACTTVEHESERAKQQKMLIHFLRSGRGISFSHMFRMKEYPSDVMPLYAQGHSLAVFLISQGGRQKFLEYVADGLKNEQWVEVTRQHYGFPNPGALQNNWLDWVRQGVLRWQTINSGGPAGPNQPPVTMPIQAAPVRSAPVQNASATLQPRRPRPEPNLIYRGQNQASVTPAGPLVTVAPTGTPAASAEGNTSGWSAESARPGVPQHDSQGRSPRTVASAPVERLPSSGWQPKEGRVPPHLLAENNSTPQRAEVGKPQPMQRPQQTILEWQTPTVGPTPGRTPAAPPQSARNFDGGIRMFR